MEVFAPKRRLLLEGSVHKVTFDARKEHKRVEEQVRVCVCVWIQTQEAMHPPFRSL